MAEEEVVHVNRDILPIVVVRQGEPAEPVAFAGTGFVAAGGLLVTCWHVVRAELRPTERYAAILESQGSFRALYLSKIHQDDRGYDLATAAIDHEPTLDLALRADWLAAGSDVLTWGFPLSRLEREGDKPRVRLESRYLEGYVTRRFMFETDGYPPTPAYELDMAAPAGLSGAPLLRRPSRELVGVIFGSNDSYSIAEEALIESETGDVRAEVRRIVSFGLAHYTPSLGELAGPATDGKGLRELMPSIHS